MAKIENTKVYPTVTPAMDDLLIATDVSNKNETVTFLVSSLIGGTGVLQGLQSVLDTGNTATQNINLTGNVTVIGTVAPTTITALGSTLNYDETDFAWNFGGGIKCFLNDTVALRLDARDIVTSMEDLSTMHMIEMTVGLSWSL